jgi:Transcriptional regulator
MIENYLLEELVTFAKYKTLAETAKQLMVTQPTITRGMQKLEEDFGVKLFDRQPNRITLTETGQLAAQKAQKVLLQNKKMLTVVRDFEEAHHQIKIASVAPGPLIALKTIELPSNANLTDQFITPDSVATLLRQNNFSLIITNQEILTDDIESRFIGTEKLSVNLDKFTYLANKNSVKFSELKGTSFIVLIDIGIWKQIIQTHIPNAKFLYQSQIDAFTEITKYSNFLYFSTNIFKIDVTHADNENDDRVEIPISDKEATMDFYASYLKEQRELVNPVIKSLSDAWI